MLTTDLKDKRIVIIGGSRGIGASIGQLAAQAGARIAWVDLHPCAEQEEALAALGAATIFRTGDCTDASGIKAFMDEVAAQWGGIDHLVYSAGFTSPVSFLDLNPEEWRRNIDINLNGAFYAIHAALPHMLPEGGAIVLIGSAAIVAGGGGRADYVSAKAGLEGLNRAICKAFGPQGVRCNIVHPSLIETELLRGRHPDPEKRKTLAADVPLRRLGQPEDIAHATIFLLSDQASYITGQSLYVDGGRTFCK